MLAPREELLSIRTSPGFRSLHCINRMPSTFSKRSKTLERNPSSIVARQQNVQCILPCINLRFSWVYELLTSRASSSLLTCVIMDVLSIETKPLWGAILTVRDPNIRRKILNVFPKIIEAVPLLWLNYGLPFSSYDWQKFDAQLFQFDRWLVRKFKYIF